MNTERQKVKKCPVCGAHAQALSFMCPYCGYIFQDDNYTSKETRELLAELQSKLLAIDNSDNNNLDDLATQKATIINTFSVPNTLDAIVQVLILSFSNIAASRKSQKHVLTKAWIAKAINCYKLLEAQSDGTKQILNLLDEYSVLGGENAMEVLDGTLAQKKKIKYISLFIIAIFVSLSAFLLYSHKSIKYNANHGHLERALALIDELDNQESIEKAFSLLEKLPNVERIATYSYEGDTCVISRRFNDDEKQVYKELGNGEIIYESHSFDIDKNKSWEWFDTLGVKRKLPEVDQLGFIYDPISMLYNRLLSEKPSVSIDKNGNVSKLIVSGKISPESECFRCESEFFYQNNNLVKISNNFSPAQFEGALDNIYFENYVNTSDLSEYNYYTLSQQEREKAFVYTEYLFSRLKPYNIKTRTEKYVINIESMIKDLFGVDGLVNCPSRISVSIDSVSLKRGNNLIVAEIYEPCLDESGELTHLYEKVSSKLLDMVQNISSTDEETIDKNYYIDKVKVFETITLIRNNKRVKQVALSFTNSIDSY